jgi:hypothetical protein
VDAADPAGPDLARRLAEEPAPADVEEDAPDVVDSWTAEGEPLTDPGLADDEDGAGAPDGLRAAVAEAVSFDIDDKGRRERVLRLGDGTRVQLIQEVFVDWRSGTSVAVVLKGWVNRRTATGGLPHNAYRLSLRHGLGLSTRKIGRTVPPIDFSPLSNGVSGFYPLQGATLSAATWASEWFTAQNNSLYLHYIGAWLIEATGEPRDNPIDGLWANAVVWLAGKPWSTETYFARRGGA